MEAKLKGKRTSVTTIAGSEAYHLPPSQPPCFSLATTGTRTFKKKVEQLNKTAFNASNVITIYEKTSGICSAFCKMYTKIIL
jgi:hypothetical protein